MKKGLLFALGVTVGFGLTAQTPKVSGVHKADLTNSKTTVSDNNSVNFYAAANAANRNSNPNAPLTAGTKFSSSYNALTLLVSQSHCLTANQALNAVMMTHRISQDWAVDANVNSGYIEYSWTPNYGTSWDSSAYIDDGPGSKFFRYPSGAIINPFGNTTIANAWTVSTGPYTDGSSTAPWKGYYLNYQAMANSATSNTTIKTNGAIGTAYMHFPRIGMASYDDSSAWVTGSLYADPSATTAIGQGYRGATLIKAQKVGPTLVWSYDSIKPSFHQDGTGANDCFADAHIAFSRDGSIGYVVFFGVDAAASTPSTRTFSPIVYKSIDHGVTWTQQPINDFTTIPVISDFLIPATGGSLKPWFDQSEGSDCVVDNNNQLHIVCTIGSGSSDDNDSLGYSWTRTGVNGTMARHYIYDVHTTPSGWDAWMIDSLMTTNATTQTIFVDGSNGGAAYPTDARLQVSATTDGSKLFYVWCDTDPFAASAENALPDLFGRGYDLTAGTYTNKVQFTSSADFYFDYVSNITLVNGNTYNIPVTNSIDRNGGHDIATTFDHYFFDQCMFTTSQFTNNLIGVNEQVANFGSFSAYPNPANEMVNVNLNMVHAASVNISIVNTLGQAVITENHMVNEGANTLHLNTSSLDAGVYFVTVSSENGKATSKIVIQ